MNFFLFFVLVLSIKIILAANQDYELHQAARHGDLESLRSLLRRMSDTQVLASMKTFDTFGYQPLHRAVKNGHCHLISFLLRNGADIDAMDMFGQTALMWAARKGYPDCVEELIGLGADVNIIGNLGTALQWAKSSGEKSCIALLKGAEDSSKRPFLFRRLWLGRSALKRARSETIALSNFMAGKD